MVKPLRINKFKYKSSIPIIGLFSYSKLNNYNKKYSLPIIKRINKDNFVLENDELTFEIEEMGEYINDGDILYFNDKEKTITTILTQNSNENTLLLTERCNSNCIFCSQPPKKINDEYLFVDALKSIISFNHDNYIGLSGGEVTINKKLFIEFLNELKLNNNKTPLHILTNGKNFADYSFTKNVIANLGERDVIWAIPIYGHTSKLHDQIVQSKNSFVKTSYGVLNLLEQGQKIEIRIVVNKLNYKELENIIDYLFSSFKVINSISIMNIEPIGFARENFEDLYVSVKEQNSSLIKAIRKSSVYGFNCFLYNYPYCLLDKDIRKNTVKSISDWKNYYPNECNDCKEKENCAGFFTSANKNYVEKVIPI